MHRLIAIFNEQDETWAVWGARAGGKSLTILARFLTEDEAVAGIEEYAARLGLTVAKDGYYAC